VHEVVQENASAYNVARSGTKYIHSVGIHQVTYLIKSEHFPILNSDFYLYLDTGFDINDAVRTFKTSPPW
jgi:hypothetical protein